MPKPGAVSEHAAPRLPTLMDTYYSCPDPPPSSSQAVPGAFTSPLCSFPPPLRRPPESSPERIHPPHRCKTRWPTPLRPHLGLPITQCRSPTHGHCSSIIRGGVNFLPPHLPMPKIVEHIRPVLVGRRKPRRTSLKGPRSGMCAVDPFRRAGFILLRQQGEPCRPR